MRVAERKYRNYTGKKTVVSKHHKGASQTHCAKLESAKGNVETKWGKRRHIVIELLELIVQSLSRRREM